jgi:HAD superfamily hydrolase (TIGR01549 family)
MDGTVTRPLLDFPRIKRDMGIDVRRPILEALAEMNDADRARAQAALHRHEEEAAAQSTLNPGCESLLRFLRDKSIPTALITRNSRRSVETVVGLHGLTFSVLVTREDSPHKPHPQPLWHACEALQVAPANAWMVGDGQYDVEAGLTAGIRTIWVSHGEVKPFAAEPWRTVADLIELTALLTACL